MTSMAYPSNLRFLVLLCLMGIVCLCSCSRRSTKSLASKSELKAVVECSYSVQVYPAGGRNFNFILSTKEDGLIINKIEYAGKEIPFECLDALCKFSIQGSPSEPTEGAPVEDKIYTPGDPIQLFLTRSGNETKLEIMPVLKQESGQDRY